MDDFVVVSFNLDQNPEADRLIRSCAKYGYGLRFIGDGHGFKNFRQLKLDLLIDELGKVDKKYVMFTDGLDSWFLKGNILAMYKKSGAKVVVSGNRDHYPESELYKGYPEAPTSFRYICSSQFIGKTKDVINTLAIIRDKYQGYTDQEGWNYCFSQGLLLGVTIDYKCRLFLNMTNVDLSELDKNGRLKETGIKPASLHFGGGKHPDSDNYKAMIDAWKRFNQ